MRIKKMLATGIMVVCLLAMAVPMTAFAYVDESVDKENTLVVEEKDIVEKPIGPLTPDGNLNLVDDYSNGQGKQFVTVTTKSGNYFYLIIDRDDSGNQTVHFLNLVDEADLFSLLDEEQVNEYLNQKQPVGQPIITEPEQEEPVEEKPEKKPAKNNNAWAGLMLLAMAGIGGGGAFAYKTIQNKKKAAQAAKPDPDADYYDEDEIEYDIPEDDADEDEVEEILDEENDEVM